MHFCCCHCLLLVLASALVKLSAATDFSPAEAESSTPDDNDNHQDTNSTIKDQSSFPSTPRVDLDIDPAPVAHDSFGVAQIFDSDTSIQLNLDRLSEDVQSKRVVINRQREYPVAARPRSMARVYADVNNQMPRAYWDYDSVNISWGVLENYEVVRKIGECGLGIMRASWPAVCADMSCAR